jgi:predicted nucleic acid-binding protein
MYLVDTYALIEWFIHNNRNFANYFKSMDKDAGFITELTILEFYRTIIHRTSKEKADEALDLVLGNMNVIDLNLELIKDAAILRSEMLKEKKGLSYADAVNYVAAKNMKIKLLTGDNDFKNLENVEFVK